MEGNKLWEGFPYVKLYRKTPKHLYPNLNGLGDIHQWILKLSHLLHIYWLPNSYWNWQEYLVSVMLISVINIKVICEWHKAIKLNDKNSRHTVVFVLRLPSTVRSRAAAVIAWRQSKHAASAVYTPTKHWDTTASTVWPSKEMQGYAFHSRFSRTVLPRTN